MTFETLFIGDFDAAEPQFVAVAEAVYIVAEASAEGYLRHIFI